MKMSELVIDESNFGSHFRDCRMNRPERGDIIARYTAIADFVEGRMKKDVIDLLSNYDKALAATQVMRKLGCAAERDAIRVCREICEDLSVGLDPGEVEMKPYRYRLEMFFYAKKESVPKDDPHWSIISIANLDSFLDGQNRLVTIKSRIVEPESAEADPDA